MSLKPIIIRGKRNVDGIFNTKRETKRCNDIIPIIGEKYIDYYTQIQVINSIYLNIDNLSSYDIIKREIIKKINGYKSQDLKKDIFHENIFVSFDNVIEKLVASKLKCYYCNGIMALVYSNIRQPNQWTLDRINNFYGHNHDNILISCLKCNLDRRNINKSAFLFTKKLKIKKIKN